MSQALHVVCVPLSVPVTKNKRFYLNLNQYRNAHHFTLSKAKVNFHEIVAPRIRHLPQFETITLIYTLFTGTEQLVDTNNVCSIVDKFFSDVLVTCKKIQDDNRKIVVGSFFQYGGVDRFDPRVEVTIIPGFVFPGSLVEACQQEEEPMQIKIVQSEIEEAIRDFVKKKLTVNPGQRIEIDLLATRGPEGYQAVIDIVDDDQAAPAKAVTEAKASSTTANVAPTPKAERTTSVTKSVTKPKADPIQEPEQAEAETTEAAPDAETVEAEAQPEPEVAEAAETVTAEEAPAQTRPSLFGTLAKPQND